MRSIFLGGAAAVALVLAGVAAPAHADDGFCSYDVTGASVHASTDADATITTAITHSNAFDCANGIETFTVDGAVTPVVINSSNTAITLPVLAPGEHKVAHNGFGEVGTINVHGVSRVSITSSTRSGSKFSVSGVVEHWEPGGFVSTSGGYIDVAITESGPKHFAPAVGTDGTFSVEFNTSEAVTVTATEARVGYIDGATSNTVSVSGITPVTVKKPIAPVTHFKTCKALHKKYSGGIAKAHVKKNTIHHKHGKATHRKLKGKVKHSTTWYNANKRLDRDHDGVACEKS